MEAVRLPGLPACACSRALNSPDFQLLVRWFEKCDCGSKLSRARCCHKTLEAEEGGVIWPLLHQCDCGDQYDPYSNPKVGMTAVMHRSFVRAFVLLSLQLSLRGPVATQNRAVTAFVPFMVLAPLTVTPLAASQQGQVCPPHCVS